VTISRCCTKEGLRGRGAEVKGKAAEAQGGSTIAVATSSSRRFLQLRHFALLLFARRVRQAQGAAGRFTFAAASAAAASGRGSKGQRKSPEQRQRPPRLREGQQGAEEVAGKVRC